MAATIMQPRSWTDWYNSPDQIARFAPTNAAFSQLSRSFSDNPNGLIPKYASLLNFPDLGLVRAVSTTEGTRFLIFHHFSRLVPTGVEITETDKIYAILSAGPTTQNSYIESSEFMFRPTGTDPISFLAPSVSTIRQAFEDLEASDIPAWRPLASDLTDSVNMTTGIPIPPFLFPFFDNPLEKPSHDILFDLLLSVSDFESNSMIDPTILTPIVNACGSIIQYVWAACCNDNIKRLSLPDIRGPHFKFCSEDPAVLAFFRTLEIATIGITVTPPNNLAGGPAAAVALPPPPPR
jgi:hypothetical protein